MAWTPKLFETEDDVREWARKSSGGFARWVEPAIGSTAGLPDLWVPVGGQGLTCHVELKIGELSNGILRYHLRPSQRHELPRMLRDGVAVGLMVGVKGTMDVVVLTINSENVGGNIALGEKKAILSRLVIPGSKKEGFWQGIHWIFSNSESTF